MFQGISHSDVQLLVQHVAFLEAQGSLDSHSQLLLDTASDCGLQALNQDGQDQNLSNLARALLMAQKSA